MSLEKRQLGDRSRLHGHEPVIWPRQRNGVHRHSPPGDRPWMHFPRHGRGLRPDIVPIPGTKRVPYLEENIAAASITLDAAQMGVLDDALAPGKVAGPRYNRTVMSMVDR